MIEILSTKEFSVESFLKGEITAEEFIDYFLNRNNIPRFPSNKNKIEILHIESLPDGIKDARINSNGVISSFSVKGKIGTVTKFLKEHMTEL